MSNRDILAIGASAGGVKALLYLAARFKPEFPASVLVTLHIGTHAESSFDTLLSRAGPLPAKFAKHGELLRKGHIYIAPADHHLLIEGNHIHLGTGPRENNSRPAIDPMLRSAALCCCARTVAVVLTGTLGDGASGLWTVNQCGGMTVVQDPRSAAFPEMPQTALELVEPDHVVDLERIPELLDSLVHQPAGESRCVPERTRLEVEIARGQVSTMGDLDHIGKRSVLSCPECQGVMWEIDEGNLTRYRCHVGHTYSPDLMSMGLDEGLRHALGSAQRALEERIALASRLHQRAVNSGHRLLAQTWAARASESERDAEIIRESLRKIDRIVAREQLAQPDPNSSARSAQS